MVYYPQTLLSPVVAYIEIAFDLGKSDITEKVYHRIMVYIYLFKVRLGSVRFGRYSTNKKALFQAFFSA